MIIIAINERLQTSQALQDIVGENIFPLSIDQKVKAPAITFNAGDLPISSKSGDAGDNHESYVLVVAQSVNQMASLIKEIRKLFNNVAWSTDEFKYIRSKVESVNRMHNREYSEYQGTIRITLQSKII